jgi:hypothetical protein
MFERWTEEDVVRTGLNYALASQDNTRRKKAGDLFPPLCAVLSNQVARSFER